MAAEKKDRHKSPRQHIVVPEGVHQLAWDMARREGVTISEKVSALIIKASKHRREEHACSS